MSDYYNQQLGLKDEETGPPALLNVGDEVEFSKRRFPDLANQRLMVKQENPRKWRAKIEGMVKEKQLNPDMAAILDIIFVGQEGQDAVLSSLDTKTKAAIRSRTNKLVILQQMKSYPWDAYNAPYMATEAMRQVHFDEIMSRAEKGDRNNERLLQAEAQTTSVMKQELTQHAPLEEKKGLLQRIFKR